MRNLSFFAPAGENIRPPALFSGRNRLQSSPEGREGMDRSTKNRLLREAAENPGLLLTREKFWKLELWPHYLRRCDDILFNDPRAGLNFCKPAPQLAAKIAERHPSANGADLFLLGYSYQASGYRRNDDLGRAEEAFRLARNHTDGASQKALAEHLRRYAYLRIFQQDPACFAIIGEAITINRMRGNLVTRHALGECLICRGRAYFVFGKQGDAFADYTAALNHVSLKIDPKPHYCVLHNLTVWAVKYGTDKQLDQAYENLKAALGLLGNWWGSPYPKLKLRWLMGIVDGRRGVSGRAEFVLIDVRKGLVKLKLLYEVGMISIDLALLYLKTRQHQKIAPLVKATAATFRSIGANAAANEALDIWRQAERLDEELLLEVREMFFAQAQPIPTIAA
ncbi:MAG: hypothetical protein GY719_30250 [bacterium]|nr:hypothetical protein [bacterium]